MAGDHGDYFGAGSRRWAGRVTAAAVFSHTTAKPQISQVDRVAPYQANALTELSIVCSLSSVGWSPTRTLHPFWGNFRVGGDLHATREDVQNDLPKCLGEWVGDLHSLKSIPLDAFARWWLLEDDLETCFGNLSFENRRRF
jgi:hypothetical protein